MTLPNETVLAGADHPGTPLRILTSPNGFYLGYLDEDGEPYTRETVYFPNASEASFQLDLIRVGSFASKYFREGGPPSTPDSVLLLTDHGRVPPWTGHDYDDIPEARPDEVVLDDIPTGPKAKPAPKGK